MSAGRTALAFALVGGVLLAACSGGPGTLGATGSQTDQAKPGYEKPGGGREAPGVNGLDGPPGGGPQAGGGGGKGCPPCDADYECILLVNGKTQKSTLKLRTTANGCADDDTVLACDGTVTSKGQKAGSWSLSGDVLNVSAGGVTGTCTKKPTVDDKTPSQTDGGVTVAKDGGGGG